MKIDWEILKEKIKSNIQDNLLSGKPSYSDTEVSEGVELFIKLTVQPTSVTSLKGLHVAILPALQEAYISKKGEMASLRVLADSFEPFLKKLCIHALKKPTAQVESMSLIPLLKLTGINDELTNQTTSEYPNLSKDKLHTFRDKAQYLSQICSAYLVRNDVHVSPSWNEIRIYTYLSDILTVLVYSCLRYKTEIQNLPRHEYQSNITEQLLNSEENKILYDFLSFGNSAMEIKTQLVHAYILHFLHDKKAASIEEIKTACDKYFDTVAGKRFYERRLGKLREANKIEFVDACNVKLIGTENDRLNKLYKDFNEDKDLFILLYSDVLQKYGVIHHFDPVLEHLTDFFIKNFNIDIAEASQADGDIAKEDTLYNELIGYIYSITTNEEIGKQLFKELLKLCEESDFVVRVSASKVLGKLSNPEQFQNYIKSKVRIVYLDTQIILYLLCTGYTKNSTYENVYFRIVDELRAFANENPNVVLKYAKTYLPEVVYQLKMALLLIPFEDLAKSEYSTNVFYQYYNYLKKNDLLLEEDDSLAKFLENWLLVKEDDAYDKDVDQIIISNITGTLENLNVEVEHLPFYENRDVAVQVLESVLKKALHSPKATNVLVNDALMVCHLSNIKHHGDEPFFLTWDKTFTEFRRAYKDKFHRDELISWHLFSPSRFLNHMSLMSFKIDPKSITNEYISILDSLDLHEKTRTLFDNLNRLTDIKDISKEQRRRYVKLTVDIFNIKEFSYEVSLPETEVREALSRSFESVIDETNRYFHSSESKFTYEQYKAMQLDQDYFVGLANIIRDELRFNIQYHASSANYIENVNKLLQKFYGDNSKESIKTDAV